MLGSGPPTDGDVTGAAVLASATDRPAIGRSWIRSSNIVFAAEVHLTLPECAVSRVLGTVVKTMFSGLDLAQAEREADEEVRVREPGTRRHR